MTFPSASVNMVSVGKTSFPPTIDILWRPDGGGNVRSWEEVMTVINGIKKPVRIWTGPDFAGPYIIPANDEPYDMHQAWFESVTIGDSPPIEMEDGAVLLNLQKIVGVHLHGRPTSAPALIFTTTPGQPSVFFIQLAAQLANFGTFPLMRCTAASFVIFGIDFQGHGFDPTSTAPIIDLDLGTLTGAFINFGSPQLEFPNGAVTGDPTSTFLLVHDGTLPGVGPFFSPGFAGTLINNPAGIPGGAGPSSFRPLPALWPIPIGCCFFDTTIAPPRPIFWDGAQWVDANGIGPV